MITLEDWALIRRLSAEGFDRVPGRLIWDNEAVIGRCGRFAAGIAELFGTLGRNYYVRVDCNDYSVDPTAISRLVAA